MIGKHYLESEVGRHKVKRHYTVACCMEERVYQDYLEILNFEKNIA